MKEDNHFNNSSLRSAGLNLSAVFDLSQLSTKLHSQIAKRCEDISIYQQLILLANGGPTMWEQMQPEGSRSLSEQHPIDSYSIDHVHRHFKRYYPQVNYQVLYPSQQDFSQPIGLQQLGELAGWHHISPLKVGINQQWGTWFAYRVLIVCDSDFVTTELVKTESPCRRCLNKDCVSACPAAALSDMEFNLDKCINYRLSENSLCHDRCVARLECPVVNDQQYSLPQIQYHYRRSLKIIKQMKLSSDQ